MSDWLPRLAPGQKKPEDLNGWWYLVRSPVYADTGIQAHLEYLCEIAQGKTIAELGMGGGDQSTIAFLAANPLGLVSYDINPPPSLPDLVKIADDNKIFYQFIHESTATAEVFACDILFIDTLHTADTVQVELERFAPHCYERIIFHDILSFGRKGQCECADQGILLAVGAFLCENPEWSVERFSKADNGLLTLRKNV